MEINNVRQKYWATKM